MKNNIHILAACSAVKDDPATSATWFQTFPPYGRYPVAGTIPKADKDAVYVFDEEAAKNILENFSEAAKKENFTGVLVDREHYSLDPAKPSDAMAWAVGIRQEADGSIWTKWEFTPKGKELWETKTLVNRSPAFYSDKLDDKTYRPRELKSIGMTNTPHFEELSTLAAARAAEVKNTQGENMKKILAKLNLAEGASEDDVVAAIDALQKKASDAETAAATSQTKADEAEAKCRKMECDAFLEANKDKIDDVAACREVYMKDPECAKKMLGACKAAEPVKKPTQQVLGAAKTPAKTSAVREGLAACKSAAERVEYVTAHAAEFAAEGK